MSAGPVLRALANPIAFRIVALLRSRGTQTTEALAEALRDVPTSSLYRQLTRLREAGTIRVVSERKARGAVERTYGIADGAQLTFDAEAIKTLPIATLRGALRGFFGSMVAEVSAYIEGRALAKTFPQMLSALYNFALSDEDYLEAVREVQRVLLRAKERSAQNPQKKTRHIYIVALPEIA